MYEYTTSGVCSKNIKFEVENNKLKNVSFLGGCNGNLSGIASLVEGMDLDKVIEKLAGLKCGFNATSCPDQLSRALMEFKDK